MKEIEILVRVLDTKEKVLDVLKKYDFVGEKITIDNYYYDPLRLDLKPNDKNQIDECFRLRVKDNETSLTYKVDNFEDNGTWIYSDEYETKVDSYKMIEQIIEKLGLKKLLTIRNKKSIYKYKEYEIAFEKVDDLGLFLEVEYCTDEDIDVKEKKKEIQNFINQMNIKVSKELNMGKPEMMLNKNNPIDK